MLTAGSKLGSYVIVEPIGAGGMGEVYRAHDSALGRDVALKVLPDAFAADADRLARFKREGQVLATLNHLNIATIYGVEEAGGVHGIALELVEGPTLADRMRDGAVPLREALSIARQIAHALEAAHEKGVVHRDLKPANVKVTPDGTVKVLDFGLAKLADPADATSYPVTSSPTLSAPATREGVILGTPAYMSPEQTRGKRVDKRADIWAFGCVLFELLAGEHPFKGETVSDVAARVLEREPDWSILPADVPPPIQQLLKRCLRKDPADRLHDIADARLEIDDSLAASPPPAAETPASAFRAPRRGVALGFAALGVIVVAIAVPSGIWFLSGRPTAGGGTDPGESLPLVIIMDSAHPRRVYDEETIAANGTNADVISDILSDLPIHRQKELIGPEWHRDEEIRLFKPTLVIIHYSGFLQEAPQGAPRDRLKLFIKFFATSATRFLIYSRAREADLNANLTTLLADVYAEHPGLKDRIRAFGLLDHGPPRWVNTVTGTELKLVVKDMLNLR